MNLYDAVTRSKVQQLNNSPTSAQPRKKAPTGSTKKSADKPLVHGRPKGKSANAADMEFTEDEYLGTSGKRNATQTKHIKSSPYVTKQPMVSSSASTRKSAPMTSPYASARNDYRMPLLLKQRTNGAFQETSRPQTTSRQKPGTGNMYDPEQPSMNSDETSSGRAVRPGAVRVGGFQSDDSVVSIMDDCSYPTPHHLVTGQQPDQPPEEPIDAMVMDAAEHERMMAERRAQEKKNAPIAGVRKDRPWYLRPVFIGAVLLLVIVVTVVAAVVATSRSDGPVTIPTYSPTSSPTSSPAPTALTTITAVVQLDAKPWETGWELTCDGDTLKKVEPGTYGLVDSRPNFRVEYETEAAIGAECELTLTDIGGDGLNPGLFEIYAGTNLGDQSARLTSGSISGGKSTIKFDVGYPNVTATSPTSAPTLSSASASSTCTLCPDGSPVLFPEAKAPIGALTCKQVEELALKTTNETACKNLQDSSASHCGCRNNCTTMCPDGTSGPNAANLESIVFVKNDQPVTCADFQADIISSGSNSVDECLSANFLGEDVCGCPPSEPFCRICEPSGGNSTTNPPTELMEREIVPGVSCRDITGIAYTLKKNDPSGIFSRLCPACLAIGAYCGCDVPPDGRDFCRLCGGKKLLPEPGRLVNSTVLEKTTTCFHVELVANIADPSTLPCTVFQNDNTLDCCFG
jgi:hypothetical protein